MNRPSKLLSAFLCFVAIAVSPASAVWIEDGMPVSIVDGGAFNPKITTDGAGGAIIAWFDYRNMTDFSIYAQRINASGEALWVAEGVYICSGLNIICDHRIVSDGAGGAVITWVDLRSGNYDIYAQRIDASGTVMWTPDGVPICVSGQSQRYPELVSDGTGGAIITWVDYRTLDYEIYAQRVNGSGTVAWAANGVPILTLDFGDFPKIASDGAGGAIISWVDRRTGDNNIYAQRIDASGAVIWTTNGVPVCTAKNSQGPCEIISDRYGGAIITWQDARIIKPDYDANIYAQRIDGSGVALWTTDGVPLCMENENQNTPQITTDGAGGAIVVWSDRRNGNYDIYVQHIDASGAVDWTVDGVPLCTADNYQLNFRIAPDGAGGAIVAWQDDRNISIDIYFQHIDASGSCLYAIDGTPLCTASETQQSPEITFDMSGGAIVTWEDHRGVEYGESDIYAQRTSYVITGAGTPETPHAAYLEQNFPNPFNPSTTIRFGLDQAGPVSLKIYDPSGRLVATIIDKTMLEGNYSETWDGKDSAGYPAPSGVYFYRLRTDSATRTRKMILLR